MSLIWAIRHGRFIHNTALCYVCIFDISAEADVKDAYITQGCVVEGEVKHSVLFTGVKIGAGARIIDSVLMPGVVVEEGAVVQRALVADGIRIGKGAVVGAADSEHIELVAKRVKGAE